jgi:hypothetical protein
VRFRAYTNYSSFIDHAEVRIFDNEESLRAVPLDVIKIDAAGLAEWQPAVERLAGASRDLKFVLRAYDAKGNFDETEAQPLWLRHEATPADVIAGADDDVESLVATAASAPAAPPRDTLAAYGESDLALHNIKLGSGTIKVQGSGVPANHTVWVAGHQVPLTRKAISRPKKFFRPVRTRSKSRCSTMQANGSLYLRDLELKRKDLFYVGVADFTLSENRTNGPAELLRGENAATDPDSTLDGRLAFYVNGKLGEHWRLTASADTREGPITDLFSNFLDKSPDALFRRIDPDYHYPTFGDDGVVEEMAPTLGKFYVKLSEGSNYGLWGNFKVGYVGNELAQVDRGLYGANAHYVSEATTSFGERQLALDGFAAQPGTMPSFEEFRGTGGSLYYLHHQDILGGSERVRIELRDKDSGIVTGVVNLRPGMDYDIDYLQGRLLLSEPLSSTAQDNLLVRSSGASGNEAFLVTRYEYTPGFDDINAVAVGGQGQYWLNDHWKVGLTANTNQEGDADSSLNAADVTWRMSSESWVKLQAGQSKGLVSNSLRSDDGGFGFTGFDDSSFSDAKAGAYRADVSVGLGDFIEGRKGRMTLYAQTLEAGYSAPGQTTLKDTEFYGGTFRMPVSTSLSVGAKADRRVQDQGLETSAIELDVSYQVTDQWSLSTGVRNDRRTDDSPVVPLTQQQGERTDAVFQATYDPGAAWRAYGFVQDTVSATEDREDNGRVGAGGSVRVSERFKVDAEISDGDLGPGGKLGTNFLFTERTTCTSIIRWKTNERTMACRPAAATWSRAPRRDSPTARACTLKNATRTRTRSRVLLMPPASTSPRTNAGPSGRPADFGTLMDSLSGAKTDRKAGGCACGLWPGHRPAFECHRVPARRNEQADTTAVERTSWLFRNNFKYQMTPTGA